MIFIIFSQVRVLASDGGIPAQTDMTLVLINVNRNLEKPEFEGREQNFVLLETTDLGIPFTTLSASDDDNLVCH